jgi:hypothetical protein
MRPIGIKLSIAVDNLIRNLSFPEITTASLINCPADVVLTECRVFQFIAEEAGIFIIR